MPSHLIRRGEVALWLRDSAVKEVTIHRTSAEAAESIVRGGVRIAFTDSGSTWGQGFYSSTIPDRQYGDVSVRVAVRLRQPLSIRDAIDGQDVLDELRGRAETDDARVAVLAAGFDGVLVHYGPGDVWVVAYHDEQVKVVHDA